MAKEDEDEIINFSSDEEDVMVVEKKVAHQKGKGKAIGEFLGFGSSARVLIC